MSEHTYCDIVIPIWNQLPVTRECIDSILNCTDYPYRLILIDNGSDPDTRDYLRSLEGIKDPGVVLIRNENNLGFVKAVNQGIKASRGQYICLMNNDTVAAKGWLSELVRILETDRDTGMVNPSSNTSGNAATIPFAELPTSAFGIPIIVTDSIINTEALS